ncbi:MAG: 3-deoxy-8-phosphooctulonate synthase [Elusimicrobia bacterium]|nr:3-deoxy-8-phosphooctulonate synthase [Elusimicrobiota bacterium]
MNVSVGHLRLGNSRPIVLIAGPCVIETESRTLAIARRLAALCRQLRLPFIFKSSYDKANRTAIRSFRGPGLGEGLRILERVKKEVQVPILTDVHCKEEVEAVARVADVLQIPAFLCRQTDLILACARTGKPVNVKKGQFLAPEDMAQVVEKIKSTGNRQILLTERGTSFGYHNLVVDMRSLAILKGMGYPVVFDATHSVQLPGGRGTASGGEHLFVPPLARAAVAIGIAALFMEVHPAPDHALSDGPNSVKLRELPPLLRQLLAFDRLAKSPVAR